jgi:diguanylate cyclase (GGDEF)-like protein
MIRSGDAAVRLGGEEFLLLLRDADAVGAERIAVEFRDRLATLSLPRSCLPRATLTVSIGIAILPHNGIVLAELVRAADVAMYEAKRAGGDRYQLSTHRPDSRRAGRSRTSIQGVA